MKRDGNERPRVLVLIERYGQGGTEKLASMLASEFVAAGFGAVFLGTVFGDGANCYPTTATEVSLGLEAPRSRFGRWTNYVRKLWRLRSLKRRLRVHVSISMLWPVDWLNLLVGGEKKLVALVINIRGNEQNNLLMHRRGIVSWIYRRADCLMACNSGFAEEMRSVFQVPETRLKYVRNPISQTAVQANQQATLAEPLARWLGRHEVVIAIGRLNQVKNFAALIPVFARVREECNDARLLLIGEGTEGDAIEAECRRCGLSCAEISDESADTDAAVCRMKFRSNIHHVLARAKVFVMPSRSEGVPLALLEAMACGVPVVVSDCPNGGPAEVLLAAPQGPHRERREVAATSGGYLMPIPDPVATETVRDWARVIVELLERPGVARAMGNEGRRIAQRHDISKVGREWANEIARLLA